MTPTGRQVQVEYVGSLWQFRLTGSGPQPPEAEWRFTSESRVRQAVADYLNRFWDISDKKRK